jgi:hypothetical protein
VIQQLQAEQRKTQLEVEKLDKAIAVIESLNGAGASGQANQPTGVAPAPTRIVSAASRRKMALAQRARWARMGKGWQPATLKTMASTSVAKRTMSPAARRKIAAAQRARWAKVRAGQKRAA